MNICELTATELALALRNRELTAVEVTRAFLGQIERMDPTISAWAHVDPDLVLRHAAKADQKLMTGAGGKLCGVPVGIKDIMNTADMPTQMGSPIWRNFTPGNDARVVHNLRMADAVILGKTVTAEFAVHAPGPTRNPHHPEYIPGTSSSGSAAGTAAGMVPLALGTQTAGSIIRPASYCGVFGFKPSFGLVPRTGMLKTTDSLDTVGLFARSIEDIALGFETIRVHGLDFPFSHARLADPAFQSKRGARWRVGLLHGPKWQQAEAYAQGALDEFGRILRAADCDVETFSLPAAFDMAHEIHATIYDRTLAYYFKEEFAEHSLVSAIMYEIVTRGNRISLQQYQQALQAQCVLAGQLDAILAERFDVVIDLATGGEALKGLESVDRLDNCLIWTLCGVPTINLPVFTGPLGLPFGAQAFTRRYGDPRLLDFVRELCARGCISRPEISGSNAPSRN